MTMTKKLIDWATVPNTVAVVSLADKSDEWVGELLGSVTNKTMLIKRTKRSEAMGIEVVSIAPCLQKYLRLAPAAQQPWLVYEEGVTVVPEWAEASYRAVYSDKIGKIRFASSTKAEYSRSDVAPVYYKLGNSKGKLFKDGWTDSPNEAV
jgi:hypothetical protein